MHALKPAGGVESTQKPVKMALGGWCDSLMWTGGALSRVEKNVNRSEGSGVEEFGYL